MDEEKEMLQAEETPTEMPEVTEEIPATDEPVEEAEVNPEEATDEPSEGEVVEDSQPTKKRKGWIWAVVIAVALALGILIVVLATDSCGGDSDSSQSQSYVNPYVSMVKNARNSSYGITYGAAFDRFFSSPEWSYFKATTGEHVVEFEGDFLYDGARARATIQFVLNMSEGTMTVYHLSINGQAQSRLLLTALVNKVFESY